MRRYELVSGLAFAFAAAWQLARVVLRVPVQFGSHAIPVWYSGLAFLATAGLALWAFSRLRGGAV